MNATIYENNKIKASDFRLFSNKNITGYSLYFFKNGVYQLLQSIDNNISAKRVIDLGLGTDQIVKDVYLALSKKVRFRSGRAYFSQIHSLLRCIAISSILEDGALGALEEGDSVAAKGSFLDGYFSLIKTKMLGSGIKWEKSVVFCPSFYDCLEALFLALCAGIRDVKIAFSSAADSLEIEEVSRRREALDCLGKKFSINIELKNLDSLFDCEKLNKERKEMGSVTIVDRHDQIESVYSLVGDIAEKKRSGQLTAITAVIVQENHLRRLFLDCCKHYDIGVQDCSSSLVIAKAEASLTLLYKLLVGKKDIGWIISALEFLHYGELIDLSSKRVLAKYAAEDKCKDVKAFVKDCLPGLVVEELCQKIGEIFSFVNEVGREVLDDSALDIAAFAQFCKLKPIQESASMRLNGCQRAGKGFVERFLELAFAYKGEIKSAEDFAFLARDILTVVVKGEGVEEENCLADIALFDLESFVPHPGMDVYFLPFTDKSFPSGQERGPLMFLFKKTRMERFLNARFHELYHSALCWSSRVVFVTASKQDKYEISQRHKFLLMMENIMSKADSGLEINIDQVRYDPDAGPGKSSFNGLKKLSSKVGLSGMSVSPTSLELLNRNPIGFYIRYGLGSKYAENLLITDKRTRLSSARAKRFGIAFHQAASIIANKIDKIEAKEIWEMVRSLSKAFELDFMAEYKLEGYAASIYDFLRSLHADGFELIAEAAFKGRLPEGVAVECRPDLIAKGKRGIIIVDYKTGSQPSFRDELRGKKLQMFMAAFCIKKSESPISEERVEDMIYLGFESKTFKIKQSCLTSLHSLDFTQKESPGCGNNIVDDFMERQELQLQKLVSLYARGCRDDGLIEYCAAVEENSFTRKEEDIYFKIIARTDIII